MKRYDPERAPDPDEWRAMDEQERIILVERYHRHARIRLPNREIHAVIHTIVENQLAGGIPAVWNAMERLMAEGLDRHDAIHAIGSVLAERMWTAMKDPSGQSFDEGAYFRRLAALTARGWREGASAPNGGSVRGS
jgi:hypothetical protein